MTSPAGPRSPRPVPKVIAATVAGAVTVLLVWIAGLFHLQVPPEAAAAVTVLLSAATGYLKSDPS